MSHDTARHTKTSDVQPLLYRRRDAAQALGCCESQVDKFRRQGRLKSVQIPGTRSVRFRREDVEALAASWNQAGTSLG